MYIWYVSVRTHTSARKFKITSTEGEQLVDTYRRAKGIADQVRQKLGNQTATIDIISGTKAFAPPAGFKLHRGHKWCPYCRKPRIFVEDVRLGVTRCPICRISDQDFYVKKYSHLFKKEYEDYLLSQKVKDR